jgi:hypothetical protein
MVPSAAAALLLQPWCLWLLLLLLQPLHRQLLVTQRHLLLFLLLLQPFCRQLPRLLLPAVAPANLRRQLLVTQASLLECVSCHRPLGFMGSGRPLGLRPPLAATRAAPALCTA